MRLVLYAVGVSAFAAKVRAALDFKGLAFEEREPPDGYGSPAYRAIVPAGSVPGLTVDGAPLHDSNAILEFLEEVAPRPPMLPEGPLARARVRALLGFHDTRVEASIRALFPLIKQADPAEAEVEAACAGVEAALIRLDEIEAPAALLSGAAPNAADLAYPCTLNMGRLLAEALGRPLALPARIAAWEAAGAALPAVARSRALHEAALRGWVASFR